MLQSLDKEILLMLPLLQNEEKESLLGVIRAFVKSRNAKVPYLEMEQYNIELNEAEVEYKKGETVSHEDLQKRIEKW
jgi:hypothetical protein